LAIGKLSFARLFLVVRDDDSSSSFLTTLFFVVVSCQLAQVRVPTRRYHGTFKNKIKNVYLTHEMMSIVIRYYTTDLRYLRTLVLQNSSSYYSYLQILLLLYYLGSSTTNGLLHLLLLRVVLYKYKSIWT